MKQFRGRFIGSAVPCISGGAALISRARASLDVPPRHPGGIPIRQLRARRGVLARVHHWGVVAWKWRVAEAAFYAYAYPEPPGCQRLSAARAGFLSRRHAPLDPAYDAVRSGLTLTRRCSISAEHLRGGANLGGWDRAALERQEAPQSTQS